MVPLIHVFLKCEEKVKLLFFRGKEEDTLRDEVIIIKRWIGTIHSALKNTTPQ